MTKILTHLQTPGNTEGGYAVDVGATKLDEVLDKDTPEKSVIEGQPRLKAFSLPCDSPLLQRNHTPSDVMVRYLRLVQRHARRSKTVGYSRNDSTSNEHSTVLGGTLEGGTDNPDPSRYHDREPPSQNVCQFGDQESSKEGTCGHGCDNGALSVGSWVAKRPFVSIVLEERRKVSGGRPPTKVKEHRHSRHQTWTRCPDRTNHLRCMRMILRGTGGRGVIRGRFSREKRKLHVRGWTRSEYYTRNIETKRMRI